MGKVISKLTAILDAIRAGTGIAEIRMNSVAKNQAQESGDDR